MIVITRNGQTTVIRGWRAWLLGALAFVVSLAALAVFAFLFFGMALTIGLVALIAIPALAITGLLASVFGRRP